MLKVQTVEVDTAATNAATEPDARLRILLPTGDLFDRGLFHSDIQLGKGPRNDVVIADPAVSSAHAVIGYENGNYSIRDLGSRNGTYLNGERLTEPRALQHGDVIGMGLSKLTFRLSSRERTEDFLDTTLVPGQVAPALTEQSLATAVVAAGSVKQGDVDRIRDGGAKGRRLYRALIDEGLVNESALRDLMSRTFHIPSLDLETFKIDDAAGARLPSQLAREHQMLAVAEEAGKLILTVADPTDAAGVEAIERETGAKVSLRLATASQIATRIEQQYAPKLIGVLPSGDKLEYPLTQHETNIGKAAHNHIVLTDPTVSNAHAILIAREGGYSIADLGSRNGTFVNSEKLGAHAHLLRHGDTIQLGQTVLTFRHPSETAANITAVLSPEALDEIRKRAASSSGEGPSLEAREGSKPPPAVVAAEVTAQPAGAAAAASEKEESDAEKKKKKKKGKDERMRAAYVSAVSRVLAQVIAVLMSVGLALYLTRSRSEPAKPVVEPAATKGKARLKIPSTGAGIPFDGGVYEASGVVQVPGSSGVYFVDDSRPTEVLWMPLDDSGRQSGPVKPIPHGASVTDPEGITYGGSFFYVVGSQSDPEAGDQNALVRFALDPSSHNLVGQAEVMTNLRSFLIANVPELKGLENKDDDGGVNVEGIAYDPASDRLMLGLRSPLAGGKALVIPIKLRDPRGQFSTANLLPPGPAIQLQLGSFGIRDIEFDLRSSAYLIISGAAEHGETLAFALWDWNGDPVQSNADSNPREVTKLDAKMKPEGVTHAKIGGKDFIFLVGDGSSYLKLDYSDTP
ncbi:MAG: DUF3616 domain-containing protein [Blastocatellia bacterium]